MPGIDVFRFFFVFAFVLNYTIIFQFYFFIALVSRIRKVFTDWDFLAKEGDYSFQGDYIFFKKMFEIGGRIELLRRFFYYQICRGLFKAFKS